MKGALDLLYVKESMKFYKAEISNEANSCTEWLWVCITALHYFAFKRGKVSWNSRGISSTCQQLIKLRASFLQFCREAFGGLQEKTQLL